jgi:predicted transcriptional regulator
MDETILSHTARIVSGYVGNNAVRTEKISTLIREVHRTLAMVGEAPTKPTKAEPVVEVRKSVFADHLVCLGCGRSFKTLKKHIMSDHQLTPEQYRTRFGLPHGYPMVASTYAKQRSVFAKKIGLGRGGRAGSRKKTGRKRG